MESNGHMIDVLCLRKERERKGKLIETAMYRTKVEEEKIK